MGGGILPRGVLPPANGLLSSQLLNQVLNRVTAERNLFDRVVTLRLPGEDLVPCRPHLGPKSFTGVREPIAPPGHGPVQMWLTLLWGGLWEGKMVRPDVSAQLIPPFLPSGLESVDHYPILVAVTGILVRLLVHGPASG